MPDSSVLWCGARCRFPYLREPPTVGKKSCTICNTSVPCTHSICFYCIDCGEAHFSQHHYCPLCRTNLAPGAIELVEVTNPSTDETLKAVAQKVGFETLFKKEKINTRDLSFVGIKGRLFAQIDHVGQASKFVVTQLMRDAMLQARRNENAKKMIMDLRNELDQKTQQMNSERQQNRADLATQVGKVNSQAQTICELTQRLEEKEDMLVKFRQRAVSSNCSVQSGDRSQNSGSMHHRYHQPPSQQRPAFATPMDVINQQKAAENRRLQERLNPSQQQIFPRSGGDGASYQSSVGNSGAFQTMPSNFSIGRSDSGRHSHPVSSMGSGRGEQGSHSVSGFHFSSAEGVHQQKRRRVSHSQSASGRGSNGYGRGPPGGEYVGHIHQRHHGSDSYN